jgi:hypothetical protein
VMPHTNVRSGGMQKQVMTQGTLCPLRCAPMHRPPAPPRFPQSPPPRKIGNVSVRFAALLALALAGCAGPPAQPVQGNLLNGAQVTENPGITRAARLTDGRMAVEGDFWLTDLATRIGSARSQITYDLGAEKPIGCAFVQGDNNDTYRVLGSKDGQQWETLWAAGPAQGAGMRLRQTKLTASARYLRLMAQGGDGFYTVTELGLFSSCPSGWPNLDLPRVEGTPSNKAAHDSLIWLAITGTAFLLLHRRGAPRWMSLLGLVPVATAIWATIAVAGIYPFANTDEESLVRAVVALLAGVLVVKESFLPAQAAPHPAVARGTLGVLAVLALGCYYHFGSAQFMDVAKGRLSIVHTWDMRNYFPTAKYFDELRFDGVYLASLAAYVDIVGNGDPASVKDAQLRDLTDYHMMNGVEAAPQLPGIRARFSPERWEEFKKDSKYFIDTMGRRDYLGSMQDHGGNATPVWLLSAWLIYRNLPANEWTLGAAGFIDPVLLLIFFVILTRTFGWRVMLYTVILFGATDFYQFGSNLAGSTLRQDWLVALGLGACALKKDRPFLGGVLLAYGGLIRAFPALAALFLLVPLAVFIADCWVQHRRLPNLREFQTAQGRTLRGVAGAAVAVIGLVVLTSGVFGLKAGWGTWIAKIEMHAVGPSTNNVGLRNLLAYRPSDSIRSLSRRQSDVAWDRRQVSNFNQLRPVFYLVNLAAFGLLILGVARRPLHQTTLLGLLLVPFFFYPSNYYCHFVFLLPMAVAGRERAGPRTALSGHDQDERLFGLVTAVIASMSVGQYFTMQTGWTDERYTQQSLLLLAGFATIIVALAAEGLRTLRAEKAARESGPSPRTAVAPATPSA